MTRGNQHLTELEDEIARLVAAYAEAKAAEQEDEAPPFVLGWAVAYETTSVSDDQRGMTTMTTINPDGQAGSLSAGLLLAGHMAYLPSWHD